MIALSAPKDKAVRAQIAESVSLIAGTDFPDQWPDLIDVRIPSFVDIAGVFAAQMHFNLNTSPLRLTYELCFLSEACCM